MFGYVRDATRTVPGMFAASPPARFTTPTVSEYFSFAPSVSETEQFADGMSNSIEESVCTGCAICEDGWMRTARPPYFS